MLSHILDLIQYVIVVDFDVLNKEYTLLFFYVNHKIPTIEAFPQGTIEHFYRVVSQSE